MQKKISTLIGAIIIVVVAVILFGGVFAYQSYSNSMVGRIQEIKIQQGNTAQTTLNNLSQDQNLPQAVANTPCSEGNKNNYSINSVDYGYEYKNVTLIFKFFDDEGVKNPCANTGIYFSTGYEGAAMIRHVEARWSNDDVKFQKTSEPNIALLTFTYPYNKYGYERYFYYINADSQKVVDIYESNQQTSGVDEDNGQYNTLTVRDIDNQIYKIGLSIKNRCVGSDEAVLNDINLDGVSQNVVSKPENLNCAYQSAGGAATLSPLITLEFIGINKDMSKVFFSVYAESSWGEKAQKIFQYNYSFDLNNKKIIEENPSDILYSAPPSFR